MSDKQNTKKTSIGGQAVIEGVMMRSNNGTALAVRDSNGIIRVERKRTKSYKNRPLLFRLPIFRGIYSFCQSLFGGSAVLMRSAEVFGEEEPSNVEKWLSKKLKVDLMSVVIFFSLFLSFAVAIFLFIFLPQLLRQLFQNLFNQGNDFSVWGRNFIEGGIKLLIFILYIVFCSLFKDVKRTFMYHGAEHKTISCYEKGLELTVENAKKCSRVHDRCGTTFTVFVLVISILVFAAFEAVTGDFLTNKFTNKILYNLIRVLCKIALLPLVAGLSYELLRALSKTNCWVFYPIKIPGLLLQRLTTKEPDEEMLEVAIVAFNEAKELEDNLLAKSKYFSFNQSLSKLMESTKKTLFENGITESSETEWIISISLGIKRDDLKVDRFVSGEDVEKVNSILSERITGRPLWYCFGDTDFYGYKIKVDERVLIPRPETEIMVEKIIEGNFPKNKILDLCTGSGAIAIALAKETKSFVFASDISEGAINLAKQNAEINNCQINFIISDMFNSICEKDFDVIVSNPPYVKSEEINTLQKEVKDFEPHIALDGGKDGLDYYRIIATSAKKYLSNTGKLFLEVGENQSKEVVELLKDNNFINIEIIKDYEGIERIVKAEVNV